MDATGRNEQKERVRRDALTALDDSTQVLSGPILVYSLYRRDWRLFVGTLCWMLYFSVVDLPAPSADTYRTRAVRAQQWWSQTRENGTLGLSTPNSYHTTSVLVALYAVAAAWRQQRFETTLGTAFTFGLYWWWVEQVVRQYERHTTPSMRRIPIE